ncbi:MAG TPA: 2Fe-2S iron-sulfur cluster-binding protein [Steroidobacteraceae bacterium]|nr:2Fe-2S iron-sulfur cluster-binding protein [Steroidobacteraceae bacterium]
MHISIANTGASFSASAEQPLLDAARGASLNLPHSCKGGNCGACKARLMRGEVHYPHGTPLGLSDAEAAEGMILLCQAFARSDLVLETFEIRAAGLDAQKRLPCRIERMVPLSHDVMGLFLRLPIAEDFRFAPGQYIDILLPGGRRRSFSIASPPHDARPLELHVRHVPGGEFTDRLFHDDMRSALLLIEGPLGKFVYRPHAGPAPPMLLIGGGTGIAPLLSILRHVIDNHIERDMRLYWGVRAEPDLYAQTTLDALSRRAASLKYAPVLSEAPAQWGGLTGWVHEAALQGIDDLASCEVYAAGPPAMIEALQREYAVRGVSPSRLYFDSFDYAPDTLVRQRMSAATKS